MALLATTIQGRRPIGLLLGIVLMVAACGGPYSDKAGLEAARHEQGRQEAEQARWETESRRQEELARRDAERRYRDEFVAERYRESDGAESAPYPKPTAKPNPPKARSGRQPTPLPASPVRGLATIDDDLATAYATEIVTRLKASLHKGQATFNAPTSMMLGETTTIIFLISPSASAKELERTLSETLSSMKMPESSRSDRVVSDQVNISNTMTAQLKGGANAFTINPQSPDTQAVASNETTKWMWSVSPATAGDHLLTLTLYANVKVNGQSTPLVLETYSRQIAVTVGVVPRVLTTLKESKEIIASVTVLLGAGGAVWAFLFRRRRRRQGGKSRPPDSSS